MEACWGCIGGRLETVADIGGFLVALAGMELEAIVGDDDSLAILAGIAVLAK